MARILVVDDDLNLLQMVRLMLERVGHEVETTNKGAEGIARAAQMKPDLAIIDIMMPDLDGYNVVRRMRADPATARIPILVLTARSQEMDKQTAMRAGANAFLSKPVTAQQLTERVNSVLEMGVDYHVHTGLLTEPMDLENARQPIGAEPLSQQPDTHDNGTPLRNVLAVTSLRGGSGGTTLAVNLGMVLARQGQRVALVDLSATGGQIGLHLRLPTPQHWGALLGMEHLPDADHVLALLTVHTPSQVAVLGAPPAPTIERLSVYIVRGMLRTLSAHFDTTLVDISTLDEASAAALQMAAIVLLAVTDDLASVQTAQQTIGVLPSLGIERERIGIALSHVHPTPDIPLSAMQRALKRPLVAEIPYHAEQGAAIRRGVPLVVAEPGGPYEQALRKVQQALARVG
jgi:CheY-like chemotaxis protein